MLNTILMLGIVAGILQLLGYILYNRKVVSAEINPSSLTWFMFAYGTALLTAMEFDSKLHSSNGNWVEVVAVILLPTICSICAVRLASLIWRKFFTQAKLQNPDLKWYKFWPDAWRLDWSTDGVSFGIDLGLTMLYVAAWVAAGSSLVDEHGRIIATLWFLGLSNATTLPGFVPIIRNTKQNPTDEHWLPWAVWSTAYLMLLVATLLGTADISLPNTWDMATWDLSFWIWVSLIVYPASNAVFHGWVAWLARPGTRIYTPAE